MFTLSNIFQTKIHPEILNIQLLNSFLVTEGDFKIQRGCIK